MGGRQAEAEVERHSWADGQTNRALACGSALVSGEEAGTGCAGTANQLFEPVVEELEEVEGTVQLRVKTPLV